MILPKIDRNDHADDEIEGLACQRSRNRKRLIRIVRRYPSLYDLERFVNDGLENGGGCAQSLNEGSGRGNRIAKRLLNDILAGGERRNDANDDDRKDARKDQIGKNDGKNRNQFSLVLFTFCKNASEQLFEHQHPRKLDERDHDAVKDRTNLRKQPTEKGEDVSEIENEKRKEKCKRKNEKDVDRYGYVFFIQADLHGHRLLPLGFGIRFRCR